MTAAKGLEKMLMTNSLASGSLAMIQPAWH
jgi:hypothetical protein